MNKYNFLKVSGLMVISILCQAAIAQKISEWRGPGRSGVYNETGLLKQWPAEGPAMLWEAAELGKGHSSPVIHEGFVFITGLKEKTEYLSKLSADGKLMWSVAYGRGWEGSFPDSRCAPTIEEERAYVTSGTGDVACINTADGNIIWKNNLFEKYQGQWGSWGISESLLLIDNKIIFSCGGPLTTTIAVDKLTGETIWQTPSINDTVAYTSPIAVEFAGKKIIINVLEYNLLGIDANTGKILWTHNYLETDSKACKEVGDWAPKINTNTPLYHDGQIYITSGYNHVGAMFQIAPDGNSVSLVWTDHTLDVHHGGVIQIDGYIYGANWLNNSNGNWCCIRWEDGKTMWEQEWNCKGSVISADGMMYLYDEKKGNLGLVKVNPEKFELVSSFRITKGSGPYWSHPVINNGILYVRHGEILMAFNIKQ